jgi:hypothetical protein
MKQVARHCDRCGQNIIEGGSILGVKAGKLVGKLPEEWDVCSDCGSSLFSWYRSGHQANQAAPGGAMSPVVGGLAVTR